ncbi:MAG: peptidyl-alpha-hydroxyglycine alpha-amidating lyase family protein [Thermomicrobiales bacterium]
MVQAARDLGMAPHFQVIPDWEQLPAGYRHGDVAGVAVDSGDRVFVLTRRDAHCLVYEPDGTFLYSFGEDVFTERAHGLTIDAHDFVYTVDDGDHTVRKFAPDGTLLLTLGTPGVPSDTGYDGKTTSSIARLGPPFNRPTNAAIAPNGDIFVADGYGNARIHRFSADGELLASWGEYGHGPGQFNVPHGIWIADDRVFVADRENDRVQIFTLGGELLEIWDHVQRPTAIYVDQRGLAYISSLWWRGSEADLGGQRRAYDLPGGVYVLDLDGNVLLHWCSADRCAPGSFVAPHCITADSRGDIYVGEVTWTFGVQRGDIPADCHTLQKFTRV